MIGYLVCNIHTSKTGEAHPSLKYTNQHGPKGLGFGGGREGEGLVAEITCWEGETSLVTTTRYSASTKDGNEIFLQACPHCRWRLTAYAVHGPVSES